MRKWIFIAPLLILASCRWVETKEEQKSKELKQMQAPEIAKESFIHADDFDSRKDDYQWLALPIEKLRDTNQLDSKKVYQHLLAENEYADAKLYDLKDLQTNLQGEFNSYQDSKSENYEFRKGSYRYFVEYRSESNYPTLLRSSDDTPTKKEVIINFGKLREEYKYFDLGAMVISPNNQYLAYAIDTVGNQKYIVKVLDITKDLTQKTSIQKCDGQIIWGKNSKSIYYVENIKNNGKKKATVYQYHFLETGNNRDEIIQSDTEGSKIKINPSKSGRFLFIYVTNNTTVKTYFIDLQRNQLPVQFREAEKGNAYYLEHQKDFFIIKTNHNSADNFKIYRSKIYEFDETQKWEVLVGHREDAVIGKMEVFENFIVLEEKVDGLKKFHILNSTTGLGHYTDFPEETYSVNLDYNHDYYSKFFIYKYSSLSTPPSVFRYDMDSRKNELIRQSELKIDFDEDDYKTERIWATSFDGTKIPISIIYKRNIKLDGTAPVLLTYEGAYGMTEELSYKAERFSLLNRGFVCAIAHLRGGGYLGEKWHLEAQKLKKVNAVMDLMFCINHLIHQEYASKSKVFVSAEGMNALIATAMINMNPNLIRSLILQNPGLDLLSNLNSREYKDQVDLQEWGNPENEEDYFYMISYSPYENISISNYPSVFIASNLKSGKSNYWEGLKWVARLREYKINENKVLIKTELNRTGNGKNQTLSIEQKSEQFAFLISLLN